MEMPVKEYNEILYPDLMLKIKGFQKKRDSDIRILRRLGFSAQIGSHLDPKKIPRTEHAYWPLATDKNEEKYQFQDKKEAYRELLELVKNGTSRN